MTSERRIFFIGLGIFLLITTIFFSICNLKTSRSFNSTLEHLNSMGLPQNFDELSQSHNISDKENAAIILTNVFRVASSPENSTNKLEQIVLDLDAKTLAQKRLSLDYSELPPEEIVELRNLISDEKILSILQSLYASSALKDAVFDYEEMVNWEYSKEFMACVKLMCLNAYLSALDGNPDKSIMEVTAILRIMNMFADVPSIPIVLVRFAGINQTVDVLEQILELVPVTNVNRDVLIELASELNRSYNLNSSSYISALDGESIIGAQTFKAILYDDLNSEEFKSRGIPPVYAFLMRYPFACVLKTDYTQFLKNIIEIRKSAGGQFFELADVVQINEDTPFWTSSSVKVLPHLLAGLRYMYVCNAKLQLARIAIGLELFYSSNAQYPLTLSVKSIIPEENNLYDPFSKQYYKYISSTNSYKLYSVGPNLVDDVGVEIGEQGELLDCVWK
ncbi:MAG: hypothetical protein PF692_09450 [Kiritimatiellae bacterium]|nr:hypothetical protein [Kiritimatiellia bacterium]